MIVVGFVIFGLVYIVFDKIFLFFGIGEVDDDDIFGIFVEKEIKFKKERLLMRRK